MCGQYKIPDILSKLTAAGVRFLPCKAQSCRGQGRIAHAPTLHTAAGVTPGNKQIKPLEWVNEGAEEVNNMSPARRCLAVNILFLSLPIWALRTRERTDVPDQRSWSVWSPWWFIGEKKKKKKNILQGLADNASQRLVLRAVPPQRLRAQWQLGIQNKTTNWICHHYHLTLWPSRIPGSEESQSPLIYEEEDEGMIHWSSPGPLRFR